MSKLRVITFMLLCAVSALALAQQASAPAGGGKAAAFATVKQKELDRIAQHLQAMQTHQSCVQAANDFAALKACNEAAHAAMKNH